MKTVKAGSNSQQNKENVKTIFRATVTACVALVLAIGMTPVLKSKAFAKTTIEDANNAVRTQVENTLPVQSFNADEWKKYNDEQAKKQSDHASAVANIKAEGKNWQSNVDDSTAISQLTIPGTHDSATFNPKGATKSLAKCQDKNIQKQLEAGVRAFDFRYVYKNGEFQLWHGYGLTIINGYECMDDSGKHQLTLKSVLTTIKDYLAQNPSEFVFINFQKEGGDKKDAELASLQDSFGVVQDSNYSNTTTLGSVRGKILNGSGFMQKASGIYNNWECSVSDKVSNLNDVFKKAPEVKYGNNTQIEQKCTYTNISWHSPKFFTTPGDYADDVKAKFLNSNPYAKYGQKAYGVVLYDFPTSAILNNTINANRWAFAEPKIETPTPSNAKPVICYGATTYKNATVASANATEQKTNENNTATSAQKVSDEKAQASATKAETTTNETATSESKSDNKESGTTNEKAAETNNATVNNTCVNELAKALKDSKTSTFKITYNLNEGKNATANPNTYTFGKGVKTLENPVRGGYKFAGWFSDADCTKAVTSISETQTGDVTLYAKWEANTAVTSQKNG